MTDRQEENGWMDEDPALVLLASARNGDVKAVEALLQQEEEGLIQLSLNCTGKSKANLGWTPLHLAAYFGHLQVAELLLENGAEVDVLNNEGDSPLHKAAYTDRQDIVMLLIKHNANVNLINAEGVTAKHLARDSHIKELIEAAESFEQKRNEEGFLKAAREGDVELLTRILRCDHHPNINSTDSFGNTALHITSYRNHKAATILLLQSGIDTALKNAKGQTAVDLARTTQMKQLLEMPPLRELQKTVQRFEGPLFRRTRFLGWKETWVVLEKGVLSFFKNRADATTGSHRRKARCLDDAKVSVKGENENILEIEFCDRSTMSLGVELHQSMLLTRQKWENALKDHIAYSSYYSRKAASYGDTDSEGAEDLVHVGSMQDALQTCCAHQQVIEKQVAQVTSAINAFSEEKHGNKQVTLLQVRQLLGQVLDSSRDMTSSLTHCLTLFTQQEELRKQQLQQEMEKSRVLQDALHVLAQEHHDLEQSVGGHRSPSSVYDSDEEFFDCDENGATGSDTGDKSSSLSDSTSANTHSNNTVSERLNGPSSAETSQKLISKEHSKWGGRRRLPVPMFSRSEFSVWTVLKQCIGKELSKITMPIIFNEPLSFLQRITEYMEYAPLLKKACACQDPVERLEYVTAFAVSAIASNWERTAKPFNPLLGETYELEREDLGFRLMAEQVSHHPPVSAFFVDSSEYTFTGSVHPKLKFWGKSVEVTPKGTVTLYLKKYDEVYTWSNVSCCVHNVIVGKLWIEHYGTLEVINHTNQQKGILNFKQSGWTGKDLHKVEGYLYDSQKNKVRAMYGKWVEGLYSFDMDSWEQISKSKSSTTRSFLVNGSQKSSNDDVNDPKPDDGSTCNLGLPGQKELWMVDPRPSDSVKYFNFTLFAMMLNEMTGVSKPPLTDSRLRPDMRYMEEGEIDKAASEKVRLEEKQRAARKERRKKKEEWTPKWFKWGLNPHTKREEWVYTSQYWDREYKDSPDIF